MSGALPPDGREQIRLVRIFSRLNVGGPSLHVIHLAVGLAPLGYETRLVIGRESAREGSLLDLALARGVDVVPLPGLGRDVRLLGDLRALFGLWRLLRRVRPHVVHTHTAKAGVVGRLAAFAARVPVVVHTYHGHVLRGYFGRGATALIRAIERTLGAWSSALVTVSESVRDDLEALGVAPGSRFRVVPLGLDLDGLAGELPRGALREQAAFAADAPLVGLVGRLAPIKDAPTFLRAARTLVRRRPEMRFSVVGDGEERAALESEARALGLSHAVFFHGWRRDLPAVYGDLDVVVNCSRNEGTPVALIEALAACRPVVATAVGGTPDLLARGAFGTLVPPQDPDALADGIERTLIDPDAARARAEAGRAHVQAHHGVPRLLSDLDGLYRELLAARGIA
ncbi:MAG TPA: glycosyltransferase [Vicinamibacteria bacterium]|nr:glycosyltransferase [Vicinamibacteria bacterium]